MQQSSGMMFMQKKINVKSVIYVIKRRFNVENYSGSIKLQNKETKT